MTTVPMLHMRYGEIFGQPTVDLSGFLGDENGNVHMVMRTSKDVSGSGDTELVPAQPGFKIRLLALAYRSALAVSVRLKSGGNNLSAAYSLGINDELVWPYQAHGWVETNVGEALIVNQSLAIASGADCLGRGFVKGGEDNG